MSMRHVTTPKRFIYASVRMDSTEMGLGVVVSNNMTHELPCIVSPRYKGIHIPGHVFLSNPESGEFLFWNLESS